MKTGFGPKRDKLLPGAYEVVHGFLCSCGKERIVGDGPVYTKRGPHTLHRCPP